ncbi:MAG: endonuclease III [Bacteroidota bacterium]
MTRKEKAEIVIQRLRQEYPKPETELQYNSPYELIVAVALSAQCTDVRVNKVTPALFERFPTVQALAEAEVDEIFEYIKSVSYPNNKSRHLKGLAERVVNEFGGEIPMAHKDLESLPGVGRKTANVVSAVLYDKPVIAVDTHVFRVSNRLGLARSKNFKKVEAQVTNAIAPEDRVDAHHMLILHGRYTCKARKPQCEQCSLTDICNFYKREQQKAERTSAA